MNDPRGSIWRKWDLHVHTPESIVHDYEGADPWPRFLDELEGLPPEFKVIGINDYVFLDGYKRVLAEKVKGRLQNIELFLPVIELRLDKFGGSQSHLSRVNYHIIFSNELDPELIEQQFLNALSSKYALTPQYERFHTSGQWKALPTRASLIDLGQRIIESVPEHERKNFGQPLIEGFNNLCLSLDSINEALDSPYFRKQCVTAVGKTEWANIKWNDQSIADKKNIINGADLVFTASETVQHFEKARATLLSGGVNARLLDCSDAHSFQDAVAHNNRLGQCFTWVKADTTFEGLLQLLIEFNERHFIGTLPPQLARVRANPTKYIKSIAINRKASAAITEKWFNNDIPVNPGLVAIIGNKGKGKSALTDIIGLLCNTRQHENFTFLSPDNFRQQRDNKARHFQATLTLESGTAICKGLDEIVDEREPELVKYIPQNFLEKVCTQLGEIEESEFDRELKKVIFSHVDTAYRLNQASLDELIAYKATEANQTSELLKQELRRINEQIIALETKAEPEFRKTIENLLNKKANELAAHESSRLPPVAKPENDPARESTIAETTAAIETAKAKLLTAEANIRNAVRQRANSAQLIAAADRMTARLDNLNRQIQTFFNESKADFESLGLSPDRVLSITWDRAQLNNRRQALLDEQGRVNLSLDASESGSLPQNKEAIEREIKSLEDALDEPNQRYQAYETAVKAWEAQRLSIIGSRESLDTIAYYQAQLEDLDGIPSQLQLASDARIAKAKEIHEVIRGLADTYRELYAPVNRFIETRALAKDKFQLNFEVGIVDVGFQEKFFESISQGSMGTFCGVEPGTKALKAILARQNFNTEAGTETFLNEIISALKTDRRPDGKGVKIGDQLRKGKTPLSLYDFIFSLDYIKPRYALRMGTKELSELSPGERARYFSSFTCSLIRTTSRWSSINRRRTSTIRLFLNCLCLA